MIGTSSHREAAVGAAVTEMNRFGAWYANDEAEVGYRNRLAEAIDAALPHLEAEWAERLLSEGLDAMRRVPVADLSWQFMHEQGRLPRDFAETLLRAALEAIKEAKP